MSVQEREERQRLSIARGLQNYLLDRQKWQANVELVTEGLRFQPVLDAERRRFQEAMEAKRCSVRKMKGVAEKVRMETKWAAEGSLLRFEE